MCDCWRSLALSLKECFGRVDLQRWSRNTGMIWTAWEIFSHVTLYSTLLLCWYWFFLSSLIHALLNACLQLPQTAQGNALFLTKFLYFKRNLNNLLMLWFMSWMWNQPWICHCQPASLCYRSAAGLFFVGNLVVSGFGVWQKEGCSLSLCNLLPPLLIDLAVLCTSVPGSVARKPELNSERWRSRCCLIALLTS